MIKICFQENERKIFSSFQLYARAYVRIWTLRTLRLVKLSPYSPGSLTLVGFVPGSNPPSPPPPQFLSPYTLIAITLFTYLQKDTVSPLPAVTGPSFRMNRSLQHGKSSCHFHSHKMRLKYGNEISS